MDAAFLMRLFHLRDKDFAGGSHLRKRQKIAKWKHTKIKTISMLYVQIKEK